MKINLNNKTVLITGAAGFIGARLTETLLHDYLKIKIIGVDNLNDYYDVYLKQYRLSKLLLFENFEFIKADISDKSSIHNIFSKFSPHIVVHLAAQAGVRYSITNPEVFIQSNIIGFFNILEECRNTFNNSTGVEHLLYASSSSVYGENEKTPYSTSDMTANPVSLYSATKMSNELMAYSYSKLYCIPTTGLRLFTVYGPAGRPDMAYFSFTNKLVKGEKIQLFNNGNLYRDFTYIDDIITGLVNIMQKAPESHSDKARTALYNIGKSEPQSIIHFVKVLEKCLLKEDLIKKPIEKELLPMQPGDVYKTYADIDPLIKDFDFKPSTNLEDGLSKFVKWYKGYYKL